MHRNLDRRSLLQQLADFNEYSFMWKRLTDVTFKCSPEKTLLSLYLSVSTYVCVCVCVYVYVKHKICKAPFFTKKMQGSDINIYISEQLHLFPCLDVYHTYPHAEFSIFQYLDVQVAFFHSSQNKATPWNWMLTHYRFTMAYYCYLDVIFCL